MLNKEDLISALLSDYQDELDAIKKYSAQLNNIDNEDVIQVLKHVIAEEQEHSQLFRRLLENIGGSTEVKIGASDIYLIRHAETLANKENKIRSIVDYPLDDNGLIQANNLGISLKDAGLSCIYTSDMKRAKQTSRAIQLNTKSDIEKSPGLSAWNLGSLAEMDAEEGDKIVMDLIKNPEQMPPGSNENYSMFLERTLNAYNEAIKTNGIIAVVTHHSNCLAILQHLGINQDIKPGESIKIK